METRRGMCDERRMMTTPRRAAGLAFALVLVVLLALLPRARILPLADFDQQFYLGIAADLRATGSFTDGYLFAGVPAPRPPGMRFAPLYPAFLAATAALDPGFATALTCLAASQGQDPTCPQTATLPRALQCAMLALTYLLFWWIARRAVSPRAGWLTLALALLCAPVLLRGVPTLMTETLTLLLTTAATACAVAACRGRPAAWLAGSGILLALAALTRPAFLYLAPFALLAGLLIAARRRRGWAACAAFAAGFALTIAPWFLRNALVLGHAALTHGYDSHTLVQRIAFNAMTWRQYALSFLCWLPDGSGMAAALFGPGTCTVFMWNERPDTFYMIGQTTLMQTTVAAAGGWDNHLAYLLRSYILAAPIWHALVTLSLALRGAWINHWWGVALAPVAVLATLRALRSGDAAMAAILLPAWFMLLFHAAVSVNQERYNLMLVLPFALSAAALVDRLWTRRAERHNPAP